MFVRLLQSGGRAKNITSRPPMTLCANLCNKDSLHFQGTNSASAKPIKISFQSLALRARTAAVNGTEWFILLLEPFQKQLPKVKLWKSLAHSDSDSDSDHMLQTQFGSKDTQTVTITEPRPRCSLHGDLASSSWPPKSGPILRRHDPRLTSFLASTKVVL